jgi:hypothetical protein
METKRGKKMKMFISHSQRDKEVATMFQKVFEEFGEYWMPQTDVEVFLSSNFSNDQRKTDQWKANFEKNLEESSVFVVLVSPKSLNSRWVQYETGYVSAKNASRETCGEKKIDVFQIGIGGVSPEACLLSDTYMQSIDGFESIIKLCTTIFNVSDKLAKGWYRGNRESIEDLLMRCTERCVYFVGSEPKSELGKGEWRQAFVDNFLKNLTTELLEPKDEEFKKQKKQFKVSSFPSVDEVGKKVFIAAITTNHADKYEVAGLYGFDKKPEDKDLEKLDEKTWKETLNKYRELYLKNKSSMIIIGGNNHTKDEYEVAKNLGHIEVFPIPCMGGLGKEQFELEKQKDEWKFEKFDHPCRACYESGCYMNQESCNQIPEFAKRLGRFIFIDEDEREL